MTKMHVLDSGEVIYDGVDQVAGELSAKQQEYIIYQHIQASIGMCKGEETWIQRRVPAKG